ncbi:MAG: hypothetical protein OJJ54_20050 [Pseudonocardia sp.]|nr:hypothetical protein [Pseudonocardia sp.]
MTEAGTTTDDDSPGDAADALALIRREQARASSQLGPNMAALFGVWGVVWLLIGVLWFLAGVGSAPRPVASWGTALAVLAGVAISAFLGIRSGRGVAGESSRQGLLYGLTWPVTMTALGVIVSAMTTQLDLPDAAMTVLVPALFVFLVGALYALSGAIWGDVTNYVLGFWIVAVAVASMFAGAPANSLVLGVGAGGGLLVVAGLGLTRERRR